MTDNAIAEADAAHTAAQLKDEAIRWRQWAIEKLLASPGSAGLMAPGWVVKSGELVEACVTPGGLQTFKRAPEGIKRIPSPIYALADDLVSYVTTGEHPGGEDRS